MIVIHFDFDMSDDKTNIEETTPVDNETSQSGEESSPKKDDRYPLKVLYCGGKN